MCQRLDRRHVEPATLRPALQAEFSQLHALHALHEIEFPRRIGHHVADEILPLGLEAIVVDLVVRHLVPLVREFHGLRLIGVPHRPRGVHAVLGEAARETGHGRAMRAVDLESDEIVALHAHGPGGVDLGDDAALELEGRIGGVVGIGGIGLSVLADTRRDVGGAKAGDGFDLAEEIVEDVAPVAEHVEDDAAAIALAIVPARSLRRLAPVTLEHPVAEFAAHREDAAEEASFVEHLDLAQARQIELVLHHAVLDALGLGEPGHGQRFLDRFGDRLFRIDMLASLDRAGQQAGAHDGGAGIKEDGVLGIGECAVDIRRGAGNAVLPGDLGDFLAIASHQDRVGHDPVAVRQCNAALIANGADRAHEMLVVAHAAGDAVHDEAETLYRHGVSPFASPEERRFVSNRIVTNTAWPGDGVKSSRLEGRSRHRGSRGCRALQKRDEMSKSS
ncbi:hypothetical protein CHELA40_50002 [Chelatococcus asaccharovorans]|nr:hypothetical protein CHELA40_50002 [Chelatococcus asaccharovorans]